MKSPQSLGASLTFLIMALKKATYRVGRLMGIEPTTTGITIRDSTTELQSPLELAHPTGLEPVTPGLEGRCSDPAELRVLDGWSGQILSCDEKKWSGWWDSNSRPSAPKADALTGLRYTPNNINYDSKMNLLQTTLVHRVTTRWESAMHRLDFQGWRIGLRVKLQACIRDCAGRGGRRFHLACR